MSPSRVPKPEPVGSLTHDVATSDVIPDVDDIEDVSQHSSAGDVATSEKAKNNPLRESQEEIARNMLTHPLFQRRKGAREPGGEAPSPVQPHGKTFLRRSSVLNHTAVVSESGNFEEEGRVDHDLPQVSHIPAPRTTPSDNELASAERGQFKHVRDGGLGHDMIPEEAEEFSL